MKNLFIIALLVIVFCQWNAYDKLYNDYMNILQAIEEEVL